MTIAANLGYPRIGPRRELKRALEDFWAGRGTAEALEATAAKLRADSWALQKAQGVQVIPSGDFAFYDLMLETTAMLGAVPKRYGWTGATVDLATAFAMARGAQGGGRDVTAMEMTKWFDTNYHYIVPELEPGMTFQLASTRVIDQFLEAKSKGIHTRPVLIGPLTWLMLGKATDVTVRPLDLLDGILPVYVEVLTRLKAAGADWVQIDEPALVLDLPDDALRGYERAYAHLAKVLDGLKLLVATYFEALPAANLAVAAALPVAGLHVDLVRGETQLDAVLAALPADRVLSLGVINGRNIWKADFEQALGLLEKAKAARGGQTLQVAPSCSLLHVPYDLELEAGLDDELKSWLAFAKQKLAEIAVLATALRDGRGAVSDALAANKAALDARRASARIHDPKVKQRVAAITPDMARRAHPFDQRRTAQAAHLKLPPLPTTTIGSFPQTKEVREARAAFKRGEKTAAEYEAFLKAETEKAVRRQEDLGIDVLVHGEFERNDMVEYFGEQLSGFAFTANGWVQSYGSRCVKPPVIFGDVSRPTPMTVSWSQYAQSLTERVMKGMLTGPVTILQWSFVRDDQPRRVTCQQIALAIRDEVVDLEQAGIRIVQIDEPAFREGLPLHRADWDAYLTWAAECFRISASGVKDETQIHTHMCYSEFNDIMPSIADLDADVISIETSRSQMELLNVFTDFKYPNEIGPGVYDIHSPRVPARAEMERLLDKALERLDPRQVWVNPDCGLKTRGWPETEAALKEMVEAARAVRAKVGA